MKKNVLKSVMGFLLTIVTIMTMSVMAFAGENEIKVDEDNIIIKKTAQWTKVDGKETDNNGNPYVLIKFEIDATNASSEIFETVSNSESGEDSTTNGYSLVDVVPKEAYVVTGTLVSEDEKVTPVLGTDEHLVTFGWGTNKLEKKVYNVSFVIGIDMSKLSEEQKSGQKMIYTNGETVDISANSMGSAYFLYTNGKAIRLSSPKLNVGNRQVAADEQEESLATTSTSDADVTPKTSDAFNIFIVFGIIASGTACYVIKIKERRRYI